MRRRMRNLERHAQRRPAGAREGARPRAPLVQVRAGALRAALAGADAARGRARRADPGAAPADLVSAIAVATSTAVEAAMPAIIVSGAVATASTASAASPIGRERGTRPSAQRRNSIWATRNSAGPPNVRMVKPSVASSPGWAIASSSPTAMPISASTISVSVHVPHQADGAGVVRGLGNLDSNALGALEVAPPERDRPCESDRQRDQALERERLVGEGGARRQDGLAQRDDEEQPEALDEMARPRSRCAPGRWRRPRPGSQCRLHTPTWVATTASPQSTSRASPSAIAPATQRQPVASSQTRSLTKCSPSGPAAQGDDQERRAPDLEEQVAGDEQPRALVERVARSRPT